MFDDVLILSIARVRPAGFHNPAHFVDLAIQPPRSDESRQLPIKIGMTNTKRVGHARQCDTSVRLQELCVRYNADLSHEPSFMGREEPVSNDLTINFNE